MSPLNDGVSKVELIGHMGDDLMVVNAARVSMSKTSKEFSLGDEKLIKYLAKHGHWTPFSQPQVQLRLKMPIFVARQWMKHQVGFTRNEVSRRYVDDTPEFFTPLYLRLRAPSVKQGSLDETALFDTSAFMRRAVLQYEEMISSGIAPEEARMFLPQSMYTEFIETASLAAYARLVGLRKDPHAQSQIRQYAAAVDALIRPLFPVAWSALTA